MKCYMLYSNKSDGNMSYNYGEFKEVDNNIEKWMKRNNIKRNNSIWIKTTDNAITITEDIENYIGKHPNLEKEILYTDGIITSVSNIFFYLKFGDCIPCILYDTKQNIMAFLHLGRKSAALNLHLKALDVLINKYKTKPKDITVTIGPCIKKESYILENPDLLKYDAWKNYLTEVKSNYYQVDLLSYIVDTLKDKNITVFNISDIDTGSNSNMFSHYYSRKNNIENGRFICGAIIKK